MRTINKIITKVSGKYGAPMGRPNVDNCKKEIVNGVTYTHHGKLFDCAVPMNGVYDKGGAYWGIGNSQLRVQYNKDLSFVRFYRKGEN